MTTDKSYFIILGFISIVATQMVSGQNLDTIKIDTRQSILNGRAFLLVPAIATNTQRGVDIMSADPNDNEETRIVMDIGTMRLVLYATELFATGDKNLLASVSAENEKWNRLTKVLTDKDSIFSILSTPSKFDSTKNAILVNSMVVRTRDNSVFIINAYINPAAYKLKDQYQKLTERIFNTLTNGTRSNERKARQETISIFGTKKSFTFNLPENYCITVDQKYDFQVFKFHKYQDYADTNWVQLIIYAGNYPSPVYQDYSLNEKDANKVKGKFLNKDIDWMVFEINKGVVTDKEQVIPCDNIDQGLLIHIAMLSNQKKSIDELTEIVENIQLTE